MYPVCSNVTYMLVFLLIFRLGKKLEHGWKSLIHDGVGVILLGTLSMHILNGNGAVSSVEFTIAHA